MYISFGIMNVEYLWLTDYLFNRSQYVTVDSIQSDHSFVTHGVPQGSILGPLLFILLINDMSSWVTKCQLILYADDAVLFYGEKDSNEIESVLNDELNSIFSWLQDNHLIINLKNGKTKFVLYGSTQRLSKVNNCSISINNRTIPTSMNISELPLTKSSH